MWLYYERVNDGFARKLANMSHGPFRVVERYGDRAVRLIVTRDTLSVGTSGSCFQAEQVKVFFRAALESVKHELVRSSRFL